MQRPVLAPDDRRVLKYRPRTSDAPPGGGSPAGGPERCAGLEAPDDFRHRMRVNIAAFAFTVLLTATGIWLAFGIANMRTAQDCVLMGRRNCATISIPAAGATGGARFVNAGPELP